MILPRKNRGGPSSPIPQDQVKTKKAGSRNPDRLQRNVPLTTPS